MHFLRDGFAERTISCCLLVNANKKIHFVVGKMHTVDFVIVLSESIVSASIRSQVTEENAH